MQSAEKMASAEEDFRFLWFCKTESMIAVQCAVRLRFESDLLLPKSIRHWCKEFEETGCLCKGM